MVRPGAINTISVRRLAILGLLRLRLTVLLAVLRIRWGVRHISLGYDAGKLGELGVGRRALAITSSFLPRTGCQCFSLRRRFGWGVASGRMTICSPAGQDERLNARVQRRNPFRRGRGCALRGWIEDAGSLTRQAASTISSIARIHWSLGLFASAIACSPSVVQLDPCLPEPLISGALQRPDHRPDAPPLHQSAPRTGLPHGASTAEDVCQLHRAMHCDQRKREPTSTVDVRDCRL